MAWSINKFCSLNIIVSVDINWKRFFELWDSIFGSSITFWAPYYMIKIIPFKYTSRKKVKLLKDYAKRSILKETLSLRKVCQIIRFSLARIFPYKDRTTENDPGKIYWSEKARILTYFKQCLAIFVKR